MIDNSTINNYIPLEFQEYISNIVIDESDLTNIEYNGTFKGNEFTFNVNDHNEITYFEICTKLWNYQNNVGPNKIILNGEELEYLSKVLSLVAYPLEGTTDILEAYANECRRFSLKFMYILERMECYIDHESCLGAAPSCDSRLIPWFSLKIPDIISLPISFNIFSGKLEMASSKDVNSLSVEEFKEIIDSYKMKNSGETVYYYGDKSKNPERSVYIYYKNGKQCYYTYD